MSDEREEECPAGDPANCPISERRSDDPRWRDMGERMDGFDNALFANTLLTREIKANTDEIVAFFVAGKGFFRVVKFIGSMAKWVTMIAAAAVTVWALFRYGVAEAMKNLSDRP